MTLNARLEETFRRSSAALVATLTRAFGPARLDLVESVVQEAFLRAMNEWRETIPDNPAGWLLSVARNLAIDHLRRERALRDREAAIGHAIESAASAAAASDFRAEPGLRSELEDDQLAMIFVACHPCNTPSSQIALALRTLCSLEVPAIARALYASEDAVEKRLVLARKRLRDENVGFEMPGPEELGSRLHAVLRVLYLLFNEGYAGTGPDLVQDDIAAEAIRLGTFLARHETTRRPPVLALLALMHFHAARFPARTSDDGALLTLREQDRSRWDARQIELGLRHLAASAAGDEASPYHYEAAIAATHATSLSHDTTDWARIVGFYDALVALHPSPGARLSRAIALGFSDAHQGAEALAALGGDDVLAALAAYHAAEGELHARLGDRERARAAIARALERSSNPHETRYLERRLASL